MFSMIYDNLLKCFTILDSARHHSWERRGCCSDRTDTATGALHRSCSHEKGIHNFAMLLQDHDVHSHDWRSEFQVHDMAGSWFSDRGPLSMCR